MNFNNPYPQGSTTLFAALRLISRDRHWWRNVLIGGALWLTIVGAPIVEGYQLESIENSQRGFPVPLPPWSDVGIKAIQGLFGLVIDFFFFLLPVLIGGAIGLLIAIGLSLSGADAAAIRLAVTIIAALIGLWLIVVWGSSVSAVGKWQFAREGEASQVLSNAVIRRVWQAPARTVFARARLHSIPPYLIAAAVLVAGLWLDLPMPLRLAVLWLGMSLLLYARLIAIQLYEAAARELERLIVEARHTPAA